MINWVCEASGGAVKIHGKGNVITNQIIEIRAIISTFFFVRGFIIFLLNSSINFITIPNCLFQKMSYFTEDPPSTDSMAPVVQEDSLEAK